jgi:hypothetical protein
MERGNDRSIEANLHREDRGFPAFAKGDVVIEVLNVVAINGVDGFRLFAVLRVTHINSIRSLKRGRK